MSRDMMMRHIKTRSKKKNIVNILMDQGKIFSGIGNYLIAEILYYAKINPNRTIDDLSDIELYNLSDAIRVICKTMYIYNINENYINDKKAYKIYYEDIEPIKNYRYNVYRREIDNEGNKVERSELVKGRTLYWVKKIQK